MQSGVLGTAIAVRDCGTFGAGAKLYLILVLFRYLLWDLHRIDLHSKVPPPLHLAGSRLSETTNQSPLALLESGGVEIESYWKF